MVSQNGIKLAVYLISSYFGDLNAKVGECLLRRGILTLAQIVRYTELSKENVKNCLLVLIHHNCVQAFAFEQEGGFGEAPKVFTQYMVLFDNIIHHMRFPKFMEIVSNELGKEYEEIFEGLLQHGRLSLNQIIDRQKQGANQGNLEVDPVQENFGKLVRARYVERCPAPEPFLALPADDEAPAKKRGAKSGKMAGELQTLEQRAIAAAAPMESIRFLVESDDLSEGTPSSVTSGKKDCLESGAELKGKKEVLWRVNFEEFVCRLRHKACVENGRARFNDEAGIVLDAILELSRRLDNQVKNDNTVPLSVNAIYEEVIKKEGGLGMNLERIRASLVQLGCQDAILDIDEKYTIDLKSILELSQNEEVESIVLKRYGREAYRMFRLLSRAERLLETEKISDSTFVEKKDTVKILYKLWNDDFVQMQKVTAPGARMSEFLLWRVNKQCLWKHALDDMYHAALNLRLRIAHELEKEKEHALDDMYRADLNLRLRIAHELEQEKEILQIPREKLVGELGTRYKRLINVRIVLESSLMNLDDSILLFHNF